MPWPDYQHPPPPDSYTRDDREFRGRPWDDYDYREPQFRGRSRSPFDDGRKRRRSPSPWDRARYEPRPRYGDERDFRRDDPGVYSRGAHGRGRGPRAPPPNPYDLDQVVQLKQFADWFRYANPDLAAMEDRLDGDALRDNDGGRPRDGIRARWEKYKRDFAISQTSLMFEHHKKSPWFAEKYSPAEEFVQLRARVRREGWEGRTEQFLLELEEGKYDPLPAVLNANGDVQSTKETLEPAKTEQEDKPPGQDEETGFGPEADDDANDEQKLEVDSRTAAEIKRHPKEDSVSVMPEGNEIMIRTIPPDIGRVKLEEACSGIPGFVHLALGEPLQKRSFYRAGWIKFQDDTDMEKAVADLAEKKLDGFKLHVNHTTRPFVTRGRTTPEVASHPERVKKDLSQIRELAVILENQAASLRRSKHVVDDAAVIGGKDSETSAVNGNTKGGADSGPRGSELVEQRAEKILQEHPDGPEERLGGEYWRDIVTLDLYREYLRAAYNTCYYCAATTDHVEELQRKCVKHTRKPLSSKTVEDILSKRPIHEVPVKTETEGVGIIDSEKMDTHDGEGERAKNGEHRDWMRNDERWLEWLDAKLALLLRRDRVDPRDYGGKDYDEELSIACEPHIKQEDEGKFRCKQCNKLFKAISFVEKHVVNKHADNVKQLSELSYYNNFALDPHRMQPFSRPPQHTGNGPPLPPQAFGLKGNHALPLTDYHNSRGMPPYGLPIGAPPPPYGAPYGGMDGGYGGSWGGPLPPMGILPMVDQKMPPHRLGDRIGDYEGPGRSHRAPPPDAREDPRAAGGRKVSYHDIDKAAAGDDANIELSY